jgi:hypothetical protein
MPTDAQQIATIKTQTLAIIAEITTSPKPSYSIDGQSVSWGAYLQQLQQTIAWCDAQASSETPFEIHSRGYT